MHAYSIHLLILSDVTVRLTTKIYGYALSRISHSVGDFKQKKKKKKGICEFLSFASVYVVVVGKR